MNSYRGVLIPNYYRSPGQQTALAWERTFKLPPKHHRTLGHPSPQPLLQPQTSTVIALMSFQRAIGCHLLQSKHKSRALVAYHVCPRKKIINAFTSRAPLHITRNDEQNLLKTSPSNYGTIPFLPSIGNISTESSHDFAALLISSHHRHGSQLLEVLLDSNLLDLADSPAQALRQISEASTLF